MLTHDYTGRFLNIRLDGIHVTDAERFPHMVSRRDSLGPEAELTAAFHVMSPLESVDYRIHTTSRGPVTLSNPAVPYAPAHCTQMSVKNCFIRGSVVRYVQMPSSAVDTQLLEDATRRGESA